MIPVALETTRRRWPAIWDDGRRIIGPNGEAEPLFVARWTKKVLRLYPVPIGTRIVEAERTLVVRSITGSTETIDGEVRMRYTALCDVATGEPA